jgi:Questin oxidase-like
MLPSSQSGVGRCTWKSIARMPSSYGGRRQSRGRETRELCGQPLEFARGEGLSRLAVTGPEFGGGLSNHGPMAAEALVRLGRADAVPHWLDGYLPRLDDAPRASDRITDVTWPQALGRLNRVADWEAYFRAQLAEERWHDVLARWWSRLLPGVAAAATHGVIRTSHAARSLALAEAAGAQAAERRDELARGLAYWAASYLELPGAEPPGTGPAAGHLELTAAVRALPVLADPVGGDMITARLKAGLAREPGFGAAVAALRPPADPQAALRDLAREFTRIFLVYGSDRPITFLHAVTAPVAAYSALPLLPDSLARPARDALWRVAAALYTVHAGGSSPRPLPTTDPPAPDDLADRAVATADEHAIKLTEACLRLHAETPDPLFLHAAARESDLLGPATRS